MTIEEQISLLERRGMTFADKEKAEYYIRFIGYFRLSGYWFPFQQRDDSDDHNNFRQPVSFDDVLALYIFDRKLRILTMDAIERIEVAARALVSDTMCAHRGPHWFMERGCFSPQFDHRSFLTRLKRDLGLDHTRPMARALFIEHYLAKYSSPEFPPSWMVFEETSFGTVSLLYKGLKNEHQKAIAEPFGMPVDRIISWLHALSHLRNTCAHHSRVWNRIFGVSPSIPKAERAHVPHPRKFYAHALVMQIMLGIVSGDTHWRDRLLALLDDHPEVNPNQLGFPDDWLTRPVWQA